MSSVSVACTDKRWSFKEGKVTFVYIKYRRFKSERTEQESIR